MKCKKDDMVVITNKLCGHGYNIGDIVKIMEVGHKYYLCSLNGYHLWWAVNDRECKRLLTELPKSIKTV
jgi:hypothetical protein